MAKYRIGSDRTGGAEECLNKICETVQAAGHEVENLGINSNLEGEFYNSSPDDIAVFVVNGMCLGTILSCYEDLIKPGRVSKFIVGIPAPIMSSKFNTRESLSDPNKKLHLVNDGSHWKQEWHKYNGQYTVEELFGKLENCEFAFGETCEECGTAIMNGSPGVAGGGTTTGTATIKDKTFEDCIRRICAATDSVFMVENNAAILFPYTDWMAFTLRQQITKIPAKQMDPDVFSIEYNTEGFYNKVTTVYGADEPTEPTTDATQNEEETTTQGNTTTVRKTMPTGGTQISEQYDPLVKIYGTLEKKVTTNFPDEETAQYVANALLIQYIREFNNSCRVRVLNQNKFIGGTFYAVENPFTKISDLYYLNSYTIFKEKDQPFTYDMEFKYGPEGAEDLLDYQKLSGGGGQVGSPVASGSEEGIWADAQKIHYLRQDSRTCSAQDPKQAYETLQPKIGQPDCYADCYGMSAYLHYRFNNQANIPCRVVGDSSHHVVMLFKNNSWQDTREEMGKLEHNFHWKTNQTTGTILEATCSTTGAGTTPNTSGTTATENGNAESATGGN